MTSCQGTTGTLNQLEGDRCVPDPRTVRAGAAHNRCHVWVCSWATHGLSNGVRAAGHGEGSGSELGERSDQASVCAEELQVEAAPGDSARWSRTRAAAEHELGRVCLLGSRTLRLDCAACGNQEPQERFPLCGICPGEMWDVGAGAGFSLALVYS